MSYPEYSQQTIIIKRGDISHVDLSEDNSLDNIADGESQEVKIYAPDNSICYTQVVYMTVPALVGGSTGSHRLDFKPNNRGLLFGQSAYNSSITFQHGVWHLADEVQYPSDEAATAFISRDVLFTADAPLTFKYDNAGADVSADGTFKVVLTVRKQVVM